MTLALSEWPPGEGEGKTQQREKKECPGISPPLLFLIPSLEKWKKKESERKESRVQMDNWTEFSPPAFRKQEMERASSSPTTPG